MSTVRNTHLDSIPKASPAPLQAKPAASEPKPKAEPAKEVHFIPQDPASELKTTLKAKEVKPEAPKEEAVPLDGEIVLAGLEEDLPPGHPQAPAESQLWVKSKTGDQVQINWGLFFDAPLQKGQMPFDKVANFLLLGFVENAQGFFMVGDLMHHLQGKMDKIRLALVQVNELLGLKPEEFLRLMKDQRFGEPLARELLQLLQKPSGEIEYSQLKSLVDNLPQNFQPEAPAHADARLRQQVERELLAVRKDAGRSKRSAEEELFAQLGSGSPLFANVYELMPKPKPASGKPQLYPFLLYSFAATATVLALLFVFSKVF